MLPNFFIVGAPKAGTTSLHCYLEGHPEVFMSNPKEVNFFSRKEMEAQNLYYEDLRVKNLDQYERLFAGVTNQKAVGEGSVSYLFYPGTPGKIKAMIPRAKIVILLRDPTARAFSHYLMDYRLGLVSLHFEDIVLQEGLHRNLRLYYQQYVELGFYYEQVKRYIDIFGKEQIRIYFQEDLQLDARRVILDLYNFLDIDGTFMPEIERRHNAFCMPKNRIVHRLYASRPVRAMTAAVLPIAFKDLIKTLFFEGKKKPKLPSFIRQYLRDLYRPDIQKLEIMLGKDLSQWHEKADR